MTLWPPISQHRHPKNAPPALSTAHRGCSPPRSPEEYDKSSGSRGKEGVLLPQTFARGIVEDK